MGGSLVRRGSVGLALVVGSAVCQAAPAAPAAAPLATKLRRGQPLAVLDDGRSVQRKENKALVVVCNGYASGDPGRVALEMLPPDLKSRPLVAPLHQLLHHRREVQQQRRSRRSAPAVMLEGNGTAADATVAQARRLRHSATSTGREAESAAAQRLHPDATRHETPGAPLAAAMAAAIGAVASGRGSSSTVWTRDVAYGTCEEYHLDLAQRRLRFTAPGGGATCDLEDDTLRHPRLVAVLTQPEASSPNCVVRAVALDRLQVRQGPTGPRRRDPLGLAAHLATVDAYTQAPPSTEEEAELRAEDREHKEAPFDLKTTQVVEEEEDKTGLGPLPPLDAGAVIRLEDELDTEVISSSVLASRTLGLGAAFAVEANSFHVILEDMRGAHLLDRKEMTFLGGHEYVAVRLGKGGDPEYPEHLLLHTCDMGTE